MPKIAKWDDLPPAVRGHLIQRMHERSISLDDLNQLRSWLESNSTTPDGAWFKDFGSFKICGDGPYPKTFLLKGQIATGLKL